MARRVSGQFTLCSFVLGCISVFAAPRAYSQITDVTNTTSTPIPGAGHDYIKALSETVNPSNGSVSLRIQVPTPPGRRLSLPFAFAYDTNGAHHMESNGRGRALWWDNSSAGGHGGWLSSLPTLTNVAVDIPGGIGPDCQYYNNYVFQDETGGRHSLDLTIKTDNTVCTNIVPKLSGGDDYYQARLTNINSPLLITGADGTVYTFPCCDLPPTGSGGQLNSTPQSAVTSSIEDRNGNIISIPGLSGGTVTDTLGRAMLSSGSGGLTVSGLSGPYSTTGGTASSSYSIGKTLVYNSGSCNTGAIPSDVQTLNVITKLTLPNNAFYTFSYDPTYAILSKITYPNGGYVSYTYGLNPLSERAQFENIGGVGTCIWHHDTVVVTHRYVSFDGVNIAQQQDFSYSTTWSNQNPYGWNSKTTTVTTTDKITGASYTTTYNYGPILLPRQVNDNTQFGGQVPVESTVVYKDTTGTTLRTVTKSWFDQYELQYQQTALENNQTSKTAYLYGAGAQVKEKDDYDYGSGAPGPLLRQIKTTYQSFASTPIYPTAPSIFDRPCQVITYDGSANRMAETDYTYDGGTTVCGTAGTPSVQDVSNLPTGTHDETHYSASSTGSRGNVTQKIQWLNTGTSPLTTYTYDKTGQVLTVTDPCGNASCGYMTGSTHTTNYSFADSYTTLVGGVNTPYTPSANTNAFITQITDPLSHTANFTYDFNSSELTVSKDANSQSDAYLYNDSFARPTQMNYPDGGQSSFAYNDSLYNQTNNTPNVQSTKAITASLNLTSTTAMDGLGHAVRGLLTSDPAGTDATDTAYDGLARVRTQSNPYRSTASSTDGTATHNYDVLGRVTSVVEQDGSTATTAYSGNCTTVTDEAGKARQSCSDGLGRLTQVFEDPGSSPHLNYETDYTYDALSNLLTVNQKGGDANSAHWRPRTFTYDSLSRLITAANPESGIICYGTWSGSTCVTGYDANGNLQTKTSPAPNQTNPAVTQTISYCYDVLDRLTSKWYTAPTCSSSSPVANYFYDQASYNGLTITNGISRRTGMSDGSGATAWSYDPMGRVLTERRTINGNSAITQNVSYTYNLDGSVATLTYPSGRIVTYTPGGAGHDLSAVDAANSVSYITGATYAPPGELSGFSSVKAGTTVSGALSYNNRLQPLQLYYTLGTISSGTLTQLQSLACPTTAATIMSRSYIFGAGTNDNGNVQDIVNCRDGNRTQNFLYDSLNRIQQAYTTGTNWGETFAPTASAPGVAPTTSGIDPWGNLTNRSGVTGKTNYEPLSVSAATNNQLTGFTYDAAGNMIQNGSVAYTYDAENRLTTTAGVTYTYDGDGQRVKKSNGTLYWGGTSSDALAETDLSGTLLEEYIYFNGKRTARREPTGDVRYYFSDHLGSASVIAYTTGAIKSESDYYPYGGEIVISSGDTNHYKFTGKERDTESGLDNFGARYDSSALGRFMTPDWAAKPTEVPYASFGDPQTLNLYSYVQNAPVNRVDADGHCAEDFCIVEGSAALLYVGAAAVVVGATAYMHTPDGQRSVHTFTSAAAASISHSIQSIKNAVHKNPPGPSNPAPGTQSGNPHAPGDVPNGQTVVRGGQGAIPSSGTYSGAQGASVAEAGKGVPHGTVSATTAGEIRASGGEVRPAPEPAYPGGPINGQHVNIEGGQSTFGEPQANPAPKPERVPSAPQPKTD